LLRLKYGVSTVAPWPAAGRKLAVWIVLLLA
jgi:hypothetical protein